MSQYGEDSVDFFYLLKKTQCASRKLPVGTLFVLTSSYRNNTVSVNPVYRVSRSTADELNAWNLGNCIRMIGGFLKSRHRVEALPRIYDLTWRGWRRPSHIFILKPYTKCMFDSGRIICASRIGEYASDISKAHLFAIDASTMRAHPVCSTNMALCSYHALVVRDEPTCLRCTRIANAL